MNGILRPGLLQGVSVLVAAPVAVVGTPVGEFIASLGATVLPFAPELDETGEGGAEWVRERAPLHALVFDSHGWSPGQQGDPTVTPLRDLLDAAWIATAAAANGAFIPGGAGGRIVFIAPAQQTGSTEAGQGDLAVPAAASGLENLARTLSVEWARHQIVASCLVPSAATRDDELGSVVAFLLSQAGAYFSGSRLDLNRLSR